MHSYFNPSYIYICMYVEISIYIYIYETPILTSKQCPILAVHRQHEDDTVPSVRCRDAAGAARSTESPTAWDRLGVERLGAAQTTCETGSKHHSSWLNLHICDETISNRKNLKKYCIHLHRYE